MLDLGQAFALFWFLGEPLRAGAPWCAPRSRRAMRGSLRSYLRASRLVRGKAAPLLSLSLARRCRALGAR